jgi:hypothetical protein
MIANQKTRSSSGSRSAAPSRRARSSSSRRGRTPKSSCGRTSGADDLPCWLCVTVLERGAGSVPTSGGPIALDMVCSTRRRARWLAQAARCVSLHDKGGSLAHASQTGGAYVKHIKLPTHARKRSVPSLIAHASTLYAPPPAPPPSLPLPMIPTTAPNGMPLAAPAGPPTPFPRSLAAPSVPPVPPLPIPYAYSSSAFLPAAPLAMPRYAPSAFVPPASSVHPYAAPGTMAARVPASTLPSAVPIKALPTPPRPPRPAGADGQPFAMPAANSHAQAI